MNDCMTTLNTQYTGKTDSFYVAASTNDKRER